MFNELTKDAFNSFQVDSSNGTAAEATKGTNSFLISQLVYAIAGEDAKNLKNADKKRKLKVYPKLLVE